MAEIVNRIANSPIVTLKLEAHVPQGDRVCIDIKDQLFMGQILREKDFRTWIASHDWAQYTDKHVAITCSVDTVIQTWAWMLLAVKLAPYAAHITVGDLEALEMSLWMQAIDSLDFEGMRDRPVVIKGCSTVAIPHAVYAEVTKRLVPIAKKVSFGEPCSTVPLYKRPS